MALKGCRTNAIAHRSDERPLFVPSVANLKPTSTLAVEYDYPPQKLNDAHAAQARRLYSW